VTRSGPIVAIAMMVMNVVTYAFNLVAARQLTPAEFGALTALLSVILIANVVGVAVQAAIARRISVHPNDAQQIVHTASSVAVVLSLTAGAIVALSTFVLSPALNFESLWPIVLCGAMLVPLTLAGAQMGVAQGYERWKRLSILYLGNGFGRMLGGIAGMLVEPTAIGAMVGLTVGAWLPVLLGLGLLRVDAAGKLASRKPLVAETFHASTILMAFFALSNVDALLARNQFSPHVAGLYAAGLILTKSTVFLPQFVSVVLFPALARDTSHRSRLIAAGLVAALGAAVIAVTAVVPQLVLLLVGGDAYADVTSRLWIFAVSGTSLAIVYILVFDALARRSRGISILLWAGVATIVLVVTQSEPNLTLLVSTVSITALTVSVALLFWPTGRRQAVEPPV
jgi:O-antigen/teichoic acid export membrane protein